MAGSTGLLYFYGADTTRDNLIAIVRRAIALHAASRGAPATVIVLHPDEEGLGISEVDGIAVTYARTTLEHHCWVGSE